MVATVRGGTAPLAAGEMCGIVGRYVIIGRSSTVAVQVQAIATIRAIRGGSAPAIRDWFYLYNVFVFT